MTKFLPTAALALGMGLAATSAVLAVPLNGTFAVTVYQGTNPNPGVETDPSQQALPSAIAALGGPVTVSSFTYTGNLVFAQDGPPPSNIAAFIASGGGTTVGTVPTGTLSNGNFTATSLFKFTFTTGGISGTITHDDGVSIFTAGTTTGPLFDFSKPTAAVSDAYNLAAGSYDLYYSEVNGLPAVLNVDVSDSAEVPEPASVALLGAALIGLGSIRRFANRS